MLMTGAFSSTLFTTAVIESSVYAMGTSLRTVLLVPATSLCPVKVKERLNELCRRQHCLRDCVRKESVCRSRARDNGDSVLDGSDWATCIRDRSVCKLCYRYRSVCEYGARYRSDYEYCVRYRGVCKSCVRYRSVCEFFVHDSFG